MAAKPGPSCSVTGPTLSDRFALTGRVAIITGGAGLLGMMHSEAIAEAGGSPVLADIREDAAKEAAEAVRKKYRVSALGVRTDITNRVEIEHLRDAVIREYGRIDILINNAANDPKVSNGSPGEAWSRFENFPLEVWHQDLAVGLTGAFLCSQVLGSEMAKRGSGVILNISSDLGMVAPDQRLYEKEGLPAHLQPVKPVTYSVVKTGLIGLTRYLATYWAQQGVRVNTLCPGGVEADLPEEFKERVHFRIPMGRMARKDEYKGAVVFLISDASSYMTGATLVVDGGRTCW
jgi:NAD(P)-dependent dehydrogenase (short-subunit alcohol dehydrogenase family)